MFWIPSTFPLICFCPAVSKIHIKKRAAPAALFIYCIKHPSVEKLLTGGVFIKRMYLGLILAGIGAGTVNGLFGAGGGMVLIPLLSLLSPLEGRNMFSASVALILPICIVSLAVTSLTGTVCWREALPYLPGSALGGYFAFRYGSRIPTKLLHRGLGLLIIWGGVRYLC